MAVSVIATPPVAPAIISASHPALILMVSDVYGPANITQFRFVAAITSTGYDLGKKFTIVSVDPNQGEFDLSETFKTIIFLRPEQYALGKYDGPPITLATIPISLAAPVTEDFAVQISEQYYDAGVFTENLGSLLNYIAARGYSDDADHVWLFANWWQFNGLENFTHYSGHTYQVYPQRCEDIGWPTYPTEPFMNIVLTEIGGGAVASWWFDRGVDATKGVVYWQMYHPGTTDQPGFQGLTVEIYTSAVSGSGGILRETFDIEKTIDVCEDPEIKLMFQDRFYQWSFLSFTKKSYKTIRTESEQAEGITDTSQVGGRYRYLVQGSNLITLNTDFLPEEINPLFEDLIQTEHSFLLDPNDGTLTQVTIVPNSLRMQTRRNDNLVQYSIQVRTSVDNFAP